MATLAQLIDDVVVNRVEIDQPLTTLGRHPDNDIEISEATVSSRHARLLREPNAAINTVMDVYIEDLGSTNGTFVNNQRVDGRCKLHNNDLIRIAWNHFKFIDDAESTLEQTVFSIDTE
ncbi:FHA domain-containing protein [Aestuariirhabdus litorea]|uniref:FHA domain-containing protein n=1 Tax=Aestuariirhabdus litorea TaxID=2528527 RepID=A0A3P3VPP2_9GAMM|nr:FHA domain-containing protein [Aestuariirhabdus litorea]RRJ84404.1 FHA domain-containing protein [Aestuariirhabdus litorea]RWW97628.1 FHA domain-containing protein [Endozoicomonadaceae bacterium GTF-13]